jgi:hypothetical protein
MSETKKNNPAFPCVSITDRESLYQGGMTMREYFAGLAMQGILANEKAYTVLSGIPMPNENLVARFSVQYADALLTELSKPTEL